LLFVNVNEAVSPRAKSRVVVDIDTGRILRAVVVVVVVGRRVVGVGIGLGAVDVADMDAVVAIDVVVLLCGGETDAIVVVDLTVAIVVETVVESTTELLAGLVESTTTGLADVASPESLFC